MPVPDEPLDDRADLERACRRVEEALRRIGGADLLDDARTESEWYVALFFPFDGGGAEPTERLSARVRVLLDRLDRAVGRGRPG